MKEEKSAPESTRRSETPEARDAARKTRTARPAPRTEIDLGNNSQAAETQQLLNTLLADEFLIYVRSLNYHWNVRGMQFHSLHAFFEKLYEEQAEVIDDVAEKVRALGAYARATLGEFLQSTRIKEQTGEPPDPRMMISTLSDDFEAVIKEIRAAIRTVGEKYDDPSTENFLTDLLEKHEKTLWMLRSHLDRELG